MIILSFAVVGNPHCEEEQDEKGEEVDGKGAVPTGETQEESGNGQRAGLTDLFRCGPLTEHLSPFRTIVPDGNHGNGLGVV